VDEDGDDVRVNESIPVFARGIWLYEPGGILGSVGPKMWVFRV
jgi:hypothetical protein